MEQYKVTRKFTGGLLKDITHTEISSVKFEVGFICDNPCVGTSPYIITECKEVK